LIEELADLCEAFDRRKQTISFAARQTQQRSIQVNVFDATELRIETGAQFQQRRYASFVPDISMSRLQGPGDDLQERRLATTVWTDDANRRAFIEFETHIAQSPEFLMSSQPPTRDRFLQPIGRSRISPILLERFSTRRATVMRCNVSEVGRRKPEMAPGQGQRAKGKGLRAKR